MGNSAAKEREERERKRKRKEEEKRKEKEKLEQRIKEAKIQNNLKFIEEKKRFQEYLDKLKQDIIKSLNEKQIPEKIIAGGYSEITIPIPNDSQGYKHGKYDQPSEYGCGGYKNEFFHFCFPYEITFSSFNRGINQNKYFDEDGDIPNILKSFNNWFNDYSKKIYNSKNYISTKIILNQYSLQFTIDINKQDDYFDNLQNKPEITPPPYDSTMHSAPPK